MSNIFFENLPIYFVNLDRAPDRLNELLKSFEDNGITNYIRIPAIDANDIKDDSTVRYHPTHRPFSDQHVGIGHYACLLSFFKAYNEFLKSDHEYAFICEDDVDISTSAKINFNFYDTLKYHNPELYNLKTSAVNQHCMRPQYPSMPVATLLKPDHLSYGASCIVNRAWAINFLNRYNALGITDYENYIFDITSYTHHYNNTAMDWLVPAIDVITFDEHTFVCILFSLFDSHRRSSTENEESAPGRNPFIEASFFYKNKLRDIDQITIDSFGKKSHKTIVCIPAGRQRYLELLIPQLLKQVGVDELHVWKNTDNPSDRLYIDSLVEKDTRIKVISHPLENTNTPIEYGIPSIGHFFQFCVDPDAVYIRLDDDIIYIEPGLIEWLSNIRWQDREHFLIAPCVINNAVVSWILDRQGLLKFPHALLHRKVLDNVGWKDPIFAEHLHRYFLNSTPNDFRFSSYEIEPVWFSVNCISWRGDEFAKFNGYIPLEENEEIWLTDKKSKELNMNNLFVGGKLCCHFSFFTQRDHLDSTDILEQYRNYINKL